MFRRHSILVLALVLGTVLAGCASNEPFSSGPAPAQAIVVGSQDYYSNEIIAEIYSQALENQGYEVDRQFRIGQREIYLPEIEAGGIDLFPEYSGPLLQYWEPDTTARLGDDVYAELQKVTPAGLHVLEQAPATDQDSYVVTKQFADQWGLTTIADLSRVTVPLTMGANSEAQTRPNGPQGLLSTYGVQASFTPIEDGGGPLTVKALQDDEIQIAIIYTADPSIAANDLVSLEDTKGLFLSSHVVPLASDRIDDQAASTINLVSEALSAEDLIALNASSVTDQLPASTIARDWLAQKGLF